MSESSEECDVVNKGVDESPTQTATGVNGPTGPPSSDEVSDSVSLDTPLTESEGEFKVPNLTLKPLDEKNGIGESKVNTSSNKSTNYFSKQNKLQSKLSPAELLKASQNPLPYKEPVWSGLCVVKYKFEVLKNGSIIDNVDLTSKSFYVFGRLPTCDVPLEHPSLSRYHAVVQYCKEKNEKHDVGWYLYDLGSTHGTWLNKQKIHSRIYYRLKVGHMLKFGGSTRLHILQGPEEDQENESDLTLTEMKEQRERKKREKEILKLAEALVDDEKALEKSEKDDVCSWGFGDDAVDEDAVNPFATKVPENEELYIDDPKKSLKGFFEREGFDLPDYQVADLGRGKYECTVELPVDSATGEPLVAEATVTGKKKEAVVACALEACRILDRMGELRKSTHESRKKKAKNWEENDFYDSEDDTFLDRTGDIERKRKQRMKRLGKDQVKVHDYQAIVSELEEVEKEISEIQGKLDKAKADAAAVDAEEGLDALDAFMANIKSGAMDSKTRMTLKRRMFDLRQQQAKLQKLAKVARPVDFKLTSSQAVSSSTPKVGSMVGKIKTPTHKPSIKLNVLKKMPFGSEFEIEEEEEDPSDTVVRTATRTLENGNIEDCMAESVTDKDTLENVIKTGSGTKEETVVDNNTCNHGDKRKSTGDGNEGTPLKRRKCEDEVETNKVSEKESDIVSAGALESDNGVSTLSTGALKPSGAGDDDDVKPVKGPTLPPAEFVPAKTKSKSGKKSVRKRKIEPKHKDLVSTDPDYQTWLPPDNQTGDDTVQFTQSKVGPGKGFRYREVFTIRRSMETLQKKVDNNS